MEPSLAERNCSLDTCRAAKPGRGEARRLRLAPERPYLAPTKSCGAASADDRFEILGHANSNAFEAYEADAFRCDAHSQIAATRRCLPRCSIARTRRLIRSAAAGCHCSPQPGADDAIVYVLFDIQFAVVRHAGLHQEPDRELHVPLSFDLVLRNRDHSLKGLLLRRRGLTAR